MSRETAAPADEVGQLLNDLHCAGNHSEQAWLIALCQHSAALLESLAADGPIVMDELTDDQGNAKPCTMRYALTLAHAAAKAEGDRADALAAENTRLREERDEAVSTLRIIGEEVGPPYGDRSVTLANVRATKRASDALRESYANNWNNRMTAKDALEAYDAACRGLK